VRLGNSSPFQIFNEPDRRLDLDRAGDVEPLQLQKDIFSTRKGTETIEKIAKYDIQRRFDNHH